MKQPENELKFVLYLDFAEHALSGWKRTDITQGYLPDGWRLRNEEGEYTRTKKIWSDALNAMDEDERGITQSEFERDWPNCNNILRKARYMKKEGDEKWFVDFFLDEKGETYFVMAEVEMPVGRETPNSFPKVVKDAVIYEPNKQDERFMSKNLVNQQHAADMRHMIATLDH